MTRLKTSDICDISSRLADYDHELLATTGRSMLGIACHAWGVDKTGIIDQINTFSIHVVPVTAGLGVITDFSETVVGILKFLGFNAHVTDESDTSGLASAFEKKTDAIMMADDNRFVGINLLTRKVIDNSEATGKVFAAALDLMAGGIKDQDVLVMGCGPVGEAGAKTFLDLEACVTLYDMNGKKALSLKERLCKTIKDARIQVEKDFSSAFSRMLYVLEATPQKNTISDGLISDHLQVAAPGVPLGISKKGGCMLKNRIVHDKLELGVAAMAVNLVLNQNQGD